MSKEVKQAKVECNKLAAMLLNGVNEPENERIGNALETILTDHTRLSDKSYTLEVEQNACNYRNQLLQEKVEQKDKVIQLMLEFIDENFDKKEKGICISSFTKYDDSCEYTSCEKCIIQYFENKAKESN